MINLPILKLEKRVDVRNRRERQRVEKQSGEL
jgi:hypothetical protein